MIDPWEAAHVLSGRALVRVTDGPDLEANPELWARTWERFRAELLPEFIARHPGQRCAAFWEFDAPEEFDRDAADCDEGESVPEYLFRHGLMSDTEIAAIGMKARELAQYNQGRRPDKPGDNFIPVGDLEQFAIDHGLLTVDEVAILAPNERVECNGFHH